MTATMMMKRRPSSPTKVQGRATILPEVVQDEDDDKKLQKSFRQQLASIKRSKPSAAALLLMTLVCLVTGALLFKYNHHDNQIKPITLHVLYEKSLFSGVIPLRLTNDPPQLIQGDRRNHYWIDKGAQYHYQQQDEEYDDGKCIPMGDWQTERNIFACNPFHEVDFDQPSLFNVGGGSYRDAWAFLDYDGTRQVIKTLAWKKRLDFGDDIVYARKEAMAMAQVSSSPYVASIYGACSYSTLMDYSPDGILWWLFDDFEPTKNELLQIAHDVAAGVADAQNVDSQGRATIVHMDIKANQFILINGTYQLNDFNMCEFLKWDPEEEEYCPFTGGYTGRWQAPEHIRHGNRLRDEKSDVFSLGYVLYFLLTGDQQWADDESRAAAKWALKGIRPKIPAEAKESTHPFDVAVIKAIHSCLQHHPQDRPTARQVADFLHNALINAGLSDAPLNVASRDSP